MAQDVLLEALGHDIEAVFLHGRDFDELSSSGDDIFDFGDIFVCDLRYGRLHEGGELGDEFGIGGVSFGELTDGAGIASNLQGVDDNDGHVAVCGLGQEFMLAPSGGFGNDTNVPVAPKAPQQLANPLRGIGEIHRSLPFMDKDIELEFADIDADVHTF